MATIIGTTGDDTLNGSATGDILAGYSGNDSINGAGGNDTIYASTGTDTLNGGVGDDLLEGAGDADVYYFEQGDGNDIIGSETTYDNNVIEFGTGISFSDLTFSISPSNDFHLIVAYGASDSIEVQYTISGGTFFGVISTLSFSDGSSINLHDWTWGTNLSDTITSTNNDDTILGFEGDDVINAEDGDDLAFGGGGNDTLRGRIGDDTLHGNDGNDFIRGEAGFDVLSGGEGNDTINGDNNSDLVSGDAGNDRLLGGQGNDTILGGDGSDTLLGGSNNDIINGGEGSDLLNGGTGGDKFTYESAADSGLISNFEHDAIQAFSQIEGDKLDFSNMAEGTFTFLSNGAGTSDFTGAGNEIAFKAKFSSSVVYVDVDGDLSADMEINLVSGGSITLTASDFIL